LVSLKVLPSTFNQPNQEYVVRIGNNFVKRNDTNEPMIGNELFSFGDPAVNLSLNLYTGNYPYRSFIKVFVK
jgi:hypothetical protein